MSFERYFALLGHNLDVMVEKIYGFFPSLVHSYVLLMNSCTLKTWFVLLNVVWNLGFVIFDVLFLVAMGPWWFVFLIAIQFICGLLYSIILIRRIRESHIIARVFYLVDAFLKGKKNG